MFLIYFNTFLILILTFGVIIIFILLFLYNIDLLINTNKIYVLNYDAININNINNLNLYSYADFIFLSNLNIDNPNEVNIENNLKEIPLYTINDNIANHYNFYSSKNNNINILLGIRLTLNIQNPFLYFRNTTLSIIINNDEVFHCYIGINENSNILDIIASIDYVINRYPRYIIIGKFPINIPTTIKNTLNDYSIISNLKIVNAYSSIISYLNSNVGTTFILNY
ncbi:unknown similar to AMEV183 [Adoxophyes honmai entomopoxvirus 'L']|uniref:Uncharacterized protein n=1 Tax=Adoxophyes honmai entomopoxvirus 'L' TaxID=1293540 RepID=A0A916KP58_9POXV|nr:unknown similar to AMEV183 [Adoxophyes honmai entomopoxvirus 'L']CCU55476.1 unknown similar to AMEV183 [Adoxophyes honmai entomopoxvirus 'L']